MEILVALTVDTELTQFSKALYNPQWPEAIHIDIDALVWDKNWYLTSLPLGKKALGVSGSSK